MGQVDGQYTRQQQGELAVRVVEAYLHYQDLAAYATMRVNGTLNLPIGTRDRSWWTLLMDECVAKRDVLGQVIRWLRTDLGMKITPRPTDWSRGMEIYIREFCLEGSEQTFDEYVRAIGLTWTREALAIPPAEVTDNLVHLVPEAEHDPVVRGPEDHELEAWIGKRS